MLSEVWLWLRQVRNAAEEYHAEFAAKEATIASLTAEAEGARSHMQAEIDRLRADMEVGTHLAFPAGSYCMHLMYPLHNLCTWCACVDVHMYMGSDNIPATDPWKRGLGSMD